MRERIYRCRACCRRFAVPVPPPRLREQCPDCVQYTTEFVGYNDALADAAERMPEALAKAPLYHEHKGESAMRHEDECHLCMKERYQALSAAAERMAEALEMLIQRIQRNHSYCDYPDCRTATAAARAALAAYRALTAAPPDAPALRVADPGDTPPAPPGHDGPRRRTR